MTCGKERVSEGAKVDANVEGQMEGRCAEVKVDEKVEGQTDGRCEEEKADAKVEGQIGGGSVEARVSEKQESKKEEGLKRKRSQSGSPGGALLLGARLAQCRRSGNTLIQFTICRFVPGLIAPSESTRLHPQRRPLD